MSFELDIALRYLRARRKQTSISVITLIAVGGVAVGVWALIVVLAVMTGAGEDLRDKILGSNAHLVVTHLADRPFPDHRDMIERIEDIDAVRAATPFLVHPAMLNSAGRSSGVYLWGIDPRRAKEVLTVEEAMRTGSFDDLLSDAAPRPRSQIDRPLPGIILGEILAARVVAFPGEEVRLVVPEAVSTPAGRVPAMKDFRVVGHFRTGMYEYDNTWAYASLAAIQDLLHLPDVVSGIGISIQVIDHPEPVRTAIDDIYGDRFLVQDWKQLNRVFFKALQLEKWAMAVILLLIVMVATFNIVSTLSMMVMEKNKDIGILKAMGATDRTILLTFLFQGLLIGAMGTAIGGVTGVISCLVADHYQLIKIPGEIYYISALPFRLKPLEDLLICGASLGVSFLTTLWPAWQASRLNPVDAIRYE